MRILGIDPGVQCMGFGLVESDPAEPITLTNFGYFSWPREKGKAYNEHLNEVIDGVAENFPRLYQSYAPDVVAAEIVPVGRLGSNTELVVASITTVKVLCFQFGIEWYDIAANTVKKEITDNGRATKPQVRKALLEAYPALAKKQEEIKKEQKKNGEKASGLPADVFDGIGVAVAVAKKHDGRVPVEESESGDA